VRRERLAIRDGRLELSLLDWGGSGPPALLHHANGFCAALWAPVAEKLSQRFRVFGMDARGHGDSDKPPPDPANYRWRQFGADAQAVAEALAERHGPLALGLGHSFGGTALAMAATERAGLFERLMLLDPIIFPSDPELRARISRSNVLAEGARRRRDVWNSRAEAREKWAAKDMFACWEPAALDLYVEEGLAPRADGKLQLKCPREVEATIFEANVSVDVISSLPKLETPVSLVHAINGNFPREHFELIAASMQHAVLIEAPTGHFVPMEDSAWVVHEVLTPGS
jgi:pimeloyl-ACP methyl ester carboxylesterase